MNFKPADFYLGIVDFLGMMVPGAVLVFLEAGWIQRVFRVSVLEPPWLIFAAAAYLFGHLLLASTELLNKPAQTVAFWIWFLRPADEEAGRLEKLCKPFLGKAASENSGANFHAALSWLRLKHAEAAAEIDRHMAGYKLLRNLVAVFFLDLLFRLPAWRESWPRLFADLILMFLFSLAFVRMLQWAYLLAFQYCVLITEQKQ
jgi:hypothetical protein